jgi:hypothetical protein
MIVSQIQFNSIQISHRHQFEDVCIILPERPCLTHHFYRHRSDFCLILAPVSPHAMKSINNYYRFRILSLYFIILITFATTHNQPYFYVPGKRVMYLKHNNNFLVFTTCYNSPAMQTICYSFQTISSSLTATTCGDLGFANDEGNV